MTNDWSITLAQYLKTWAHPFALLMLSVSIAACGSTLPSQRVSGVQGEREDTAVDGFVLPDSVAPGTAAPDGRVSAETGTPEAPRTESPRPDGMTGRRPGRQDVNESSAAPAAREVRGVTHEVVTMGFVAISPESAASSAARFGVERDTEGDAEADLRAVVERVNATGGVAGRQLEPVIIYRQGNDEAEQQRVCAEFTEDRSVFAVLSPFKRDMPSCYAQRQTLFLLNASAARERYIQNSPYMWSPGAKTDDTAYATLIDGLAAQGYFEGDVRVGFLVEDISETRKIYEEIVIPRLARLGITDAQVTFVSGDASRAPAQLSSAVIRFRSSDVNRVVFMVPGAAAPLVFMSTAEGQMYRPRYGLSTYDQPGITLQGNVPDSQLEGAMGVGWMPVIDVDPSRGETYPSGRGEQDCHRALVAADRAHSTRAEAAAGSHFCDGAFMLQAAARGLDRNLTAPNWAAAAQRLGTAFQSALGLPDGTRFAEGRQQGNTTHRFLFFDDACSCFDYSSGNRPDAPDA